MKGWKKAAAATVALATLALPLPTFAAGTGTGFTDLGQTEPWAKEAIEYAQETGLVNGDPSGAFRPTETITRAEVAKLFAQAARLSFPKMKFSNYADVGVADWHHPYIEAVRSAGLMRGDGDGRFRPQEPISREELAVVLARAFELPLFRENPGEQASDRMNPTIPDDDDLIASWAYDAVQTMRIIGVLEGDGADFRPQQPAQRQEAVAMLVRLQNVTAHDWKITGVGEGYVAINGIVYEPTEELLPIFTAENAELLEGAKVQYVAEGRKLLKLTYLEVITGGSEVERFFYYNNY